MKTEQAIAGKPRRSRKKLILLITLVDVVVIAAVVGGWWMLRQRPPRPTDSPVSVIKFAATPEFANLSQEQKAPYLEAIRKNLAAILAAADSGKLTREEQAAAMRNVIRARARVEMSTYSVLTTGSARQAHLDQLINEQEQLRQAAAKAAANGQPVGPSLVALKQFVETLSPEERVQMTGFVVDLMKRRTERGLNPWPFPGSG